MIGFWAYTDIERELEQSGDGGSVGTTDVAFVEELVSEVEVG